MDEAYAYAQLQTGVSLLCKLVLRGADSEDDLSKYVFMSRPGTMHPLAYTGAKLNKNHDTTYISIQKFIKQGELLTVFSKKR